MIIAIDCHFPPPGDDFPASPAVSASLKIHLKVNLMLLTFSRIEGKLVEMCVGGHAVTAECTCEGAEHFTREQERGPGGLLNFCGFV